MATTLRLCSVKEFFKTLVHAQHLTRVFIWLQIVPFLCSDVWTERRLDTTLINTWLMHGAVQWDCLNSNRENSKLDFQSHMRTCMSILTALTSTFECQTIYFLTLWLGRHFYRFFFFLILWRKKNCFPSSHNTLLASTLKLSQRKKKLSQVSLLAVCQLSGSRKRWIARETFQALAAGTWSSIWSILQKCKV